MTPYGKYLKRMSFKELQCQRDLWRLRSRQNKWFYSLPMHQAVLDEIERREKKERNAVS